MFITWGQGGVDFEPKKGGGRTEIGVFPVRVWGKRGAERGESWLRATFWQDVARLGVGGWHGRGMVRGERAEFRVLAGFGTPVAMGGVQAVTPQRKEEAYEQDSRN